MLVGYARCSTDAQHLTAQHNALTTFGVKANRIYVDHGLPARGRRATTRDLTTVLTDNWDDSCYASDAAYTNLCGRSRCIARRFIGPNRAKLSEQVLQQVESGARPQRSDQLKRKSLVR